MNRDIYKSFEDVHGDIHHYTVKENLHRRNLYREAINCCCWPDCVSGYDLQVHHIVPIRKGGNDDFVNYIVMCKHCHRHNRLHRAHLDKLIEILTYKLYMEIIELGFSSDDYCNEEFQLKLNVLVANRKRE